MRIRILSAAEEDLEEGFRFYESQSPGLGSYFLDSLYSDIDSLAYFGGFHQVVFGYHRQALQTFPVRRVLPHYRQRGCGLCCPRLSSEPKLDKRKTDEGLSHFSGWLPAPADFTR